MQGSVEPEERKAARFCSRRPESTRTKSGSATAHNIITPSPSFVEKKEKRNLSPCPCPRPLILFLGFAAREETPMESVLIRSCSPPLLTEAGDLCDLRSSSSAKRAAAAMSQRFAPVVTCSSRSDACIPKLELFSRSKLERGLQRTLLIQKCENELADYCSTLEGDNLYSCWRACFELKDLEKESPKEEVERLIIQAGGAKSLIGCLHGIAEINKGAKKNGVSGPKLSNAGNGMEKHCPMPDGLPKSLEELEEEEMGRLPDSPYTRFAQKQGKISLLGIRLPRCREGIAKERDLDASPRPLRSLPSTLSLSVLPRRRAPTPCGRRGGRLEVSMPIGVDNRRLGLVRRRLVPMGRERMLKDNISAKIQKEKRKKESRVSGFCRKTASGG